MTRISIMLIILIIGSLIGCDDTSTPIDTTGPAVEKTPDEIVLENCALVQEAAEAFAAENKGQYAKSVSDTSLAGNSIIDLLPNGELLSNPYTGLYTEPQTKMLPDTLGEILYIPTICNGFAVGYYIISYNDEGDFFEFLTPYSEEYYYEEFATACNCFTLELAVKRFAADNSGVYPRDVDVDTSEAGRTVMSYLVNPQENWFTELLTEPRNGQASSPGEVGYLPVTANGIPVGYYITGFGEEGIIKTLSDIPEIQL